MVKKNIILWIIGILIFLFLVAPKLNLELFTIFPDEAISRDVYITNQNNDLNFLEGDTILPYTIDPVGTIGYLIFVNDKLYKEYGIYNYAPHYSQCPEPWGNQNNQYNKCDKWQYGYKEIFECSANNPRTLDPVWEDCTNLNFYPTYYTGQGLQAGNDQEVEVILALTTSQGISHHYNNFKINVASLPCTLDTGQNIVVQTFQSGSIINKNVLRYSDYFVKTCSGIPPIIVDSFTKTSYTDLNILTQLNNNFDYVVPQDKVVALFYVVDNNPEITLICGAKAFNPDSGLCEDINAFIIVCSEGVFNPETGTCTLIPGIEYLCLEGFRYDSAQNVCIANINIIECEEIAETIKPIWDEGIGACIYTPETVGICIQGQWDGDKCIITENLDYLCLKGTLVDNNGTITCQIIPDITYNCISGFTYNEDTKKCETTSGITTSGESSFPSWILYVAIGIIILVIVLSRRRRR